MSIDFDEYPITQEEVISILGTNYKKQGNELVWACPACRSMGGDTAGDNLKYNTSKQVLKCFACDFAEEVVGIIARRRFEAERGSGEVSAVPSYITNVAQAVPKPPEEKPKEIQQKDLDEYYWNCHVALMKNKDVLRKMYQKHTILPITALKCMIGYDSKKDMLVFPSRATGKIPNDFYDLTPNGAEYREYEGDKTVRRISGYSAKICRVYGETFTPKIGIICEGYKDAYNLLQLLKVIDTETYSNCYIFTVQNGTNSINHECCLQKVNWKVFNETWLLMDNDEAGDKATKTALDLFPSMIDKRKELLCGCNDIQDRFERQFGGKIDIEKALSAEWLKEYEVINS